MLILLAVFLIYTMVDLQSQLSALKREYDEVHKEKTEKAISKEELKELQKDESMDKLIEWAARDKLDYVYMDEEVYIDISDR